MKKKNKPFLLKEKDILEQCDGGSWSRGQGYFKSGMVSGTYMVDNVLRARCAGSMSDDYHIRVILSEDGIDDYLCTCPRGGFCKHIVALLLTYIHCFEAINVINFEEMREELNRRSKEELVDDIIQLFRENPELVFKARETSAEDDNLDTTGLDELIETYTNIADRCFITQAQNPYQAANEARQKLGHLWIKAEQLAEKNSRRAIALLTAIFESIENHFNEVDDSNAVLSSLSAECLERLIDRVLTADIKAEERQGWQQRMFRHYIHNDYGLGDGVGELLLETYQDEDLDFLKKLVEEALGQFTDEPSWHSDFMRGELSRFLAQLQQAGGEDTEAILQTYRSQGLHFDYTVELLRRQRIDEGIHYAKEHLKEGYDIYRFAKILLEHRLTDEAENFLESAVTKIKINGPYYEEILAQLASIYEIEEEWEEAAQLYIKIFKAKPTLDNFKNLEKVGKHLTNWQTTQNDVSKFLQSDRKYRTSLIEIFLYLKQVDSALAYIEKEDLLLSDRLYLELAKAAEKKRPHDAVNIYKQVIEKWIPAGGQGNYNEAVIYLKRIKNLSPKEEFQDYLSTIIRANRRRRLLLEAMKNSDLYDT